MQLRILHLRSSGSAVGGLERWLIQMCQGLQKLGHTSFIGTKDESAMARLAEEHGYLAGTFRGGAMGYFSSVFLVRRLVRELDIDLIVTHGRSHFSRFMAGARSVDAPVVATVHTWDQHPQRYSSADRVIAVSQAVGDRLVQGGVPRDKVVVVRNGINTEDMELLDPAECRQELGLPQDCLVMAFVGRLELEKGPHVALQAFAGFAQADRESRLVLAGAGALENELRDIARATGLTDRVVFLGQRDDVARVYRAADIVLMPSLSEPLGRTALEAMACERPVLASRTGGLAEVIADGETGYLFEPGNAEQLAGCIGKLAVDRGLREAMGRAGRGRVQSEFRHALTVERSAQVYEEVVAGTPPRPRSV